MRVREWKRGERGRERAKGRGGAGATERLVGRKKKKKK